MPISFSQIASNTASIVIPVGDDKVSISYYPARVTEEVVSDLLAFSSLESAPDPNAVVQVFEKINITLCNLIEKWDLYQDDAQTELFPLEPAQFGKLPLAFRLSILNAIMGDIRPESFAPQTTGAK